jgi:peptidoglycan/xylan/chitin deacetylase (PgdA/CDA1 family)
MIILHNIGPHKHNSNYNTIEEILAHDGPISFDGVYRSVYKYRQALKGKDITLFVTGYYVGKDNAFDEGQPLEEFCNWNEIMEIVKVTGAKIGWHTWNHLDLTKWPRELIREQVTPPIPMDYFAYPYGKFNDMVIEEVKRAGFKKAYSVTEGDGSDYKLKRKYL